MAFSFSPGALGFYTGISPSANPVSGKNSRFKVGDIVMLQSDQKTPVSPNCFDPYWPETTVSDFKGQLPSPGSPYVNLLQQLSIRMAKDDYTELSRPPVLGVVEQIYGTSVQVFWWSAGDTYLFATSDPRLIRFDEFVKRHGKKLQKPPQQLDLAQLDRVVLQADKKEAILAVLKQHDKKKLLFEEWGLGETIEYGRGMTMLLYGPPGTGKTFMANCIAKALGKELLSLGTAELESHLAGEMEKNVVNAFTEARQGDKVLLFDECDSLLFSRQHVGMILGAQINCLLREIEKFEGVCLLTTNRLGELDEALERRLALILKFPEPDRAGRKEIWTRLLPKKLPLGKDVSLDALAEYELTGGLIKNVILGAARHAAAGNSKRVELAHFDKAMKDVARGRKAFLTEPSHTPTTRGHEDLRRQ